MKSGETRAVFLFLRFQGKDRGMNAERMAHAAGNSATGLRISSPDDCSLFIRAGCHTSAVRGINMGERSCDEDAVPVRS